MLRHKDLIFLQQIRSNMKLNSRFKVNQQDQNVGLILTFIGLR